MKKTRHQQSLKKMAVLLTDPVFLQMDMVLKRKEKEFFVGQSLPIEFQGIFYRSDRDNPLGQDKKALNQ